MSKWKTHAEAVEELTKRNDAVVNRHGICHVLAIEPELVEAIGRDAVLVEAKRTGIVIVNRATGERYT